MRDYIIRERELGILSRTKKGVSDKYGNKRRHLVYWSEHKSDETMRFFYLTALIQKWMINTFANDLKPKIINDANTRKQE